MKSNVFSQNSKLTKLTRTQLLVYSAVFISISIVLKILFEVYIPLGGFPSLRINLNTIPIILSGFILGPIPGFIIGIISDLLCYVIKPNGPLFLGFTLSSGLAGFIPGILWILLKNRKSKYLKFLNLGVSALALIYLFITNTINFSNGHFYYFGEPLNIFVAILFFLLILLFSLFPFFGKFLLRKANFREDERILLIITVEQIVNSVLLNTLWLTILYGQAWMVLLPARIITNIFLIPFYSLIISIMFKYLPSNFKNLNE